MSHQSRCSFAIYQRDKSYARLYLATVSRRLADELKKMLVLMDCGPRIFEEAKYTMCPYRSHAHG